MIQIIAFTGSTATIHESTAKATKKANAFFNQRLIARNQIVAQTTNTNAVAIDGETFWIDYTITLFLDLPYDLENDDEPYSAM